MIRTILAFAFFAFSISLFSQADGTETVFGKGGLQPVRLTGFWFEWQPLLNRTSFGANFLSRFSGSMEFNRSFEIGASAETSHSVFAPPAQAVQLDFSDGWAAFLGYRFREKKLVHPTVRFSGGSANADFKNIAGGFDSQILRFGHFQAGIEANLFRWMRLGATSGYFFSENATSQSLGELDLDGWTLGLHLRLGFLMRRE